MNNTIIKVEQVVVVESARAERAAEVSYTC